jgi:4-amino-4-deoxy-L-arabinose transferase-like glycosyltransferase
LAAGLLYHHWQIIVAPVPLDLYEGTMPLITGIIAEGNNPYTRAFQPQAADVYPPLYNLLVAPLSLLFGNTFQLHRSVSAVFIVASSALCGFTAIRNGASRLNGMAVTLLMYAALLFYGTPVSSTNAPGVALFLAGLLVPWFCRFGTGSLVFSLLCGLLSFYTKQYFILGMAILCLYLFLCVSMRRALLLGTAYATLLLASLVAVHYTSPYYLDNTLFAPAAAVRGLQTWEILGLQVRFFLGVYAGLLVAMSIAGFLLAREKGALRNPLTGPGLKGLAGSGLTGPLLARPLDYFWFCLFWATVAIVVSLGRNPGNWMTYLFQLISPFLLLAGISLISRSPIRSWVVVPLLVLNFFQAYAILHKDFSVDMHNWREMEQLIAGSDEVLASQMLVMTLLEQGKTVYQDGHTFYFPLAASKPDWFLKPREEDRVSAVWNDYMTGIYRKIERREFDLILVSPWEMRGIFLRNPPPFEEVEGRAFLSRHYAVERKIELSMTDRYGGGSYNIQVWRPRG